MSHTLALAALAALALALRARGQRFHWWVLPTALGLHWLLWTGFGRRPLFLGACAAFLVAVVVSGWKRRNPVPIASLPPVPAPPRPRLALVPAGGPLTAQEADAGLGLRAWTDAARAMAEARAAAPRAYVLAAPPPPPPEADPTPAPLPRASAAPASLLDTLWQRADSRQRTELWPQLAAPGERIAAPLSLAQVAARPSAGWFGRERCAGVTLEWEPLEAPEGTTVLVLRGVGDGLPGDRGAVLALVATSLPGVKALGGGRFAGRGVFVPLHLVLP